MLINASYKNNNVSHVKHAQAFTAGKVHLWFDYDGTYAPEGDFQSSMENIQNYRNWDQFLHRHEKTVDLNITTGRNAFEFKFEIIDRLADLIRSGIRNFLPSTLVIKNGGEKYEKTILLATKF